MGLIQTALVHCEECRDHVAAMFAKQCETHNKVLCPRCASGTEHKSCSVKDY